MSLVIIYFFFFWLSLEGSMGASHSGCSFSLECSPAEMSWDGLDMALICGADYLKWESGAARPRSTSSETMHLGGGGRIAGRESDYSLVCTDFSLETNPKGELPL